MSLLTGFRISYYQWRACVIGSQLKIGHHWIVKNVKSDLFHDIAICVI